MSRMPYKNRLLPYTIEWLKRWSSEDAESGCWLWNGSLNKGGYGTVGYKGGPHNAHRVSYLLTHGELPIGMDLDHLCRTRRCINPDHLEPVSRSENLRRGNAGDNLRDAALAKTECPRGHPYSGKNLFVDKRGRRDCKICRIARTAAWREKHRLVCSGEVA